MLKMLYSDEREDYEKGESIDKYSEIFFLFVDKVPTLEEALLQMVKSRKDSIGNVKDYVQDVIKNSTVCVEENLSNIKKKYPKLNKDEAIIINSYTYENRDTGNFQDNAHNAPYRILNQNLVSQNRKQGINNVSKYLFIFLKSLRKIQKYVPENLQNCKLYRCIRRLVDRKPDPKNPKFVPYCEGSIKIFYGFTSTTPNRNTAE